MEAQLPLPECVRGLVFQYPEAKSVRAGRLQSNTHLGVELERWSPGGSFRGASNSRPGARLIQKQDAGVAFRNGVGQAPQSGGKHATLQPRATRSQCGTQFQFRHQGRGRIDHQKVQSAGSQETARNFESLLGGCRPHQRKPVNRYSHTGRVAWVEGMLRVNPARGTAKVLKKGHDAQCDGGLAGPAGAEDFDNRAAGKASDAQGRIKLRPRSGYGRGRSPLASTTHTRDLAVNGAVAVLLGHEATGAREPAWPRRWWEMPGAPTVLRWGPVRA